MVEAGVGSQLFPGVPSRLLDSGPCRFLPAPELGEWARSVFLEPGSLLNNPAHWHLLEAEILWVWSSEAFRSQGRTVVGTAQRGRQQGSAGKRELLEFVYRGWHGGELPDFVVTLCAPYCAECSEGSFCALVEHELFHCAQKEGPRGPMFDRTGRPVFCLRGHDVEEFTGVVERYGAHSVELRGFRDAMLRGDGKAGSGSGERGWPEGLPAACGCGALLARS